MQKITSTHEGRVPERRPAADIVLVGVSRCGKTPLSMYLAVFGWKVFNLPFIVGQGLPRQLKEVDPRRVIGLSIEPQNLVQFRRNRQASMGLPRSFPYATPSNVYEEIEEAMTAFRREGFAILDMTEKPIEAIAEQIIALMVRNFGNRGRP